MPEDVLLYACMIEAGLFLKHPDSVAGYTAQYAQSLQSLQAEMGLNMGHENSIGA